MADVSNGIDCIVENPCSKMKGMQEKKSIMGVRDRLKNLSFRITVWHHLASQVMLDSDSRDRFFYLPLTPMIDSYILLLIQEGQLSVSGEKNIDRYW